MEETSKNNETSEIITDEINQWPFFVQVMCLPAMWIIAILKMLVTAPIWIIAKCNVTLNRIK